MESGVRLVAGLLVGGALACVGPARAEEGDYSCALRALEAAEQRYGRPVEIATLLLFRASADLDVRDPDQPLHLNRFPCKDGEVGETEPVHAGRNQRRLEARLFNLETDQLAILPQLLPTAVTVVGAEDAEVTHVILERSETTSNSGRHYSKPRFRVYVEGPRGGGYAEFRLDGKRGRVVRW